MKIPVSPCSSTTNLCPLGAGMKIVSWPSSTVVAVHFLGQCESLATPALRSTTGRSTARCLRLNSAMSLISTVAWLHQPVSRFRKNTLVGLCDMRELLRGVQQGEDNDRHDPLCYTVHHLDYN